jgi:uncharacterized membrane protein
LIAPEARFGFRHASLVTVVAGGVLAARLGYLPHALLLRNDIAMGLGMWLALIMAFNVWFALWPRQKNQKKVHGFVDATTTSRRAGDPAGVAHQPLAAVPMTWCMIAQQNGGR